MVGLKAQGSADTLLHCQVLFSCARRKNPLAGEWKEKDILRFIAIMSWEGE